MHFRIRFFPTAKFQLERAYHFDPLSVEQEVLHFEGSDLDALTTELCQSRASWVGTKSVTKERAYEPLRWGDFVGEMIAVNRQDKPAPDWDSREAHEFCKALSAFACDEVFIYNFLHFPLPLLKIFLGDKRIKKLILHDEIPEGIPFLPAASLETSSSTGSLPLFSSLSIEAKKIAFSGELRLCVRNILRSHDGKAYASYLQKAYFDHPNVCLQRVMLCVKILDAADMQEYQVLIKAVSSIQTKSLHIDAKELPACFLSNSLFTPFLEFLYLDFWDLCLSLSDERVFIRTEDTKPRWWVVVAWLQQIRLVRSCEACHLDLEPKEEMNPEHYLPVFESLCALQVERLEITATSSRSSSPLLAPILLRSFQSSGEAIQELYVAISDWNWMNDEVVEAMKGNTRILGLKVLPWHQEEIAKKLENVLGANHTISTLEISGVWSEILLTRTMKMYLELNRDGKRQLATECAPTLSPEKWIGFLISTTENAESADDLKLSCLFHFVREHSSYYTSLFLRP